MSSRATVRKPKGFPGNQKKPLKETGLILDDGCWDPAEQGYPPMRVLVTAVGQLPCRLKARSVLEVVRLKINMKA